MTEEQIHYDKAKDTIRTKKMIKQIDDGIIENEWQEMTAPKHKIGMLDISKLGTGVLIGGGLGLLAGVGTIAVAASAFEIIIGGVITKVAGVVGGATGLGLGLKSLERKNRQARQNNG